MADGIIAAFRSSPTAMPTPASADLRSRERLLNQLLSKVLKRQLSPDVHAAIGELRRGGAA